MSNTSGDKWYPGALTRTITSNGSWRLGDGGAGGTFTYTPLSTYRMGKGLTRLYKLADDGITPVPCDIDDWPMYEDRFPAWLVGRWEPEPGVRVSTVFLGLDHGFSMDMNHEPVLWETMIFGVDQYKDYQERYTSYTQALAGHERAVELVRSALAIDDIMDGLFG